MPELPEVEVLVRHLDRVLPGRRILGATVHRPRVARPETSATLAKALRGATVERVRRRAKYLLFDIRHASGRERALVSHLGMTGRMWVQDATAPLPKHAAVSLELDSGRFVFEDVRGFGRMNLDVAALDSLGPEPWADAFTPEALHRALGTSRQAIKVRLLDQTLVAGVGNIYASEALFRAGISPKRKARLLKPAEAAALRDSIRTVLEEAIARGMKLPPDAPDAARYYRAETVEVPEEPRFNVYDRRGFPCPRCAAPIRRITQAARSTYFCPHCQR
jgi:formamidopyrimidine-DNA glycosylase